MKPLILKSLLLALASLSICGCGDSCRKINCQNGGYCYDNACICEKWYSGDDCQLLYNRNYEGSYEGMSIESGRSVAKEIIVIADPNIPNRLRMQSGIYFDLETDSSFLIPQQEFKYDSLYITIIGEGRYDIGFIEFSYGEQENPLVNKPNYYLEHFQGQRALK